MLSKKFLKQAKKFKTACEKEATRLLAEGKAEAASTVLDASVNPAGIERRAKYRMGRTEE